MKILDITSGIQKRYLRYTLALLVVTLILAGLGSWGYMQNSLTKAVSDKYEFMVEKMGISLDNLFEKSGEVTAECIIDDDIQKSLRAQPLEEVEKNALSKYFAYVDLENIAEYCYVDNKGNVYTRSYSKVTYEEFQASGFETLLGDSYAGTKWIWTKDTLFGKNEDALFIGRYVHSMDYAHEPGMLFFKMDEEFLRNVIDEEDIYTSDITVGIVDADGKICAFQGEKEYADTEFGTEVIKRLSESRKSGMIADGERVEGGVLSAYRQSESGMSVFVFVPDRVLNSGMRRLVAVLLGISLIVMLIALVLSIYFSKRFTKPIQIINEAMTGFDGNDFSKNVHLNTHTELDQIGQSYNEMLGNIRRLLEEIKSQERELRISELNMLMNQINPHFLYNTLDTIYMLARINGEETTMKMIQALSKYLRLSLSKGSDIVSVEDELENVKSYMEIQQIRNENLFRYEVDCQVDAQQTWVLKLILQPLVENAIKHGFCEIYEGGLIRIEVREEEGNLIFVVFNSGLPMRQEEVEMVNALNGKPLLEIKECFKDKQHGYGIGNVITRLRLKYGEEVQFKYETEENGTRCIIRIPDDGKENRDF